MTNAYKLGQTGINCKEFPISHPSFGANSDLVQVKRPGKLLPLELLQLLMEVDEHGKDDDDADDSSHFHIHHKLNA